jgi:hypothetical protein
MKKIVVVDIDGTIANISHRLKFCKTDKNKFFDECSGDKPIQTIIDLIENICDDYDIVFCTGRPDSVRTKTIIWLTFYLKKSFKWKALLMRKSGDMREDEIVKPELLVEAGIDFNDIAFILEDRNSVVDKWRELGLTCLQVAEGNF